MPWRLQLTCKNCGATEHRTIQDDEEPGKHVCRAYLITEDAPNPTKLGL
jgi:hypothetical protein